MEVKKLIDWINNFDMQIRLSNNLLYNSDENYSPVSKTSKLNKLIKNYNSFKKRFVEIYKKLDDSKYNLLTQDDINKLFYNLDNQIKLIKEKNVIETEYTHKIKEIKSYCKQLVKMYIIKYNININYN